MTAVRTWCPIAIVLFLSFPATGQTFGMRHRGMPPMRITSSIPTGTILEASPETMTLAFSPAMRLDRVELLNSRGETIPTRFDSVQVAESAVIEFTSLPADSYTLRYSADAGDHMMPGSFRFIVR